MSHVKGVVDAFFAAWKPGDAFILPQRMELIAPPRQDLVPVGLMSNVPDQLVFRSIEDIVQRHRELDGTQAGSQMPARLRDGVDHEAAQFICELSQLLAIQLLDVGGAVNFGKQREVHDFFTHEFQESFRSATSVCVTGRASF